MGLINFLLLKFRELTKNTEPKMSQEDSPPVVRRITEREKAIAVAERVSVTENGDFSVVFCPVCSKRLHLQSPDVKILLALHLSLWHPDDVELRWDIIQNEGKPKMSDLFSPLDAGIAAGVAALLVASLWKIHSQCLLDKMRRR